MAALSATSAVHRIIAVGDLHGDYGAWHDIARAAGLIDPDGRWVGRQTVLVQTGDVVDRGPNSARIIQDLMRLQREADRAGGRVIALVGNHEAMNVTGDLRYVSAPDLATYTDDKSIARRDATFEANKSAIQAAYRAHDPQMGDEAIRQAWIAATPLGRLEHRIAWRPNGRLGQWVTGNPAVVLVDGNLFVHGGISPAYADMPLDEINRKAAAALAAQSTDPQAIINDPQGSLWYRGLAEPLANDPEDLARETPPVAGSPPVADQLDHLLKTYGARRVVIAHTPILSGIAMLYDTRLIRIDTGISSVYCGKVAYLEILAGSPSAHEVVRSSPCTRATK